ncbi:hypothetical protein ACET3Z_008201 [Daucus carota]
MGNINSASRRKALALKHSKRKTTTTNIVVTDSIFPPEIIIEILSWVEIECHGTLMLVCKHWNALIQDRHFMEKHMSRAQRTVRKFVYYYKPDVKTNRAEEIVLRRYYRYVYACDGLYLLKNVITKKYCIRNPFTKQALELPDPHEGIRGIVFSYVPSTSNYKFVSVYDDERGTECCEVLSVGSDELSSWRVLKMPKRDYLKKQRKKFSVVSTGDAVHCVRVIARGAVMVEEVISLDLGTEKFTVTNIPSGLYESWEKVWPLNFMGKLVLVDRMGADLCVLELEDYKKQKWGKRKTLIPSASMKALEDEHGTVFPYSFDFQLAEVFWFWVKDTMFISYDLRTREENELERLEKEGFFDPKPKSPANYFLIRTFVDC